MTTANKRFDSEGFFKIPPGVDPFAYLASTHRLRGLQSSSGTIPILWILLFFHTLVILFCLFFLVKSGTSRVKKFRWLYKILYIQRISGGKVRKYPLYFFNSGILMTATQLLSSASSQGYIWIQTRSSLSSNHALHSHAMLCLGLMNMFETLCHWSMSHCFLVTMYVAHGLQLETKTGVMRWVSSPVFSNFFIIFFPICVVLTTVAAYTWMMMSHKHLLHKVSEMRNVLSQASSAWKQLHGSAHQSAGRQAQITSQLASTEAQIGEELFPSIENWLFSIHISLSILLVLVCITGAVLVLMCYLLIQRYRQEGIRSNGDHQSSRCNDILDGFKPAIFRSSLLARPPSPTPRPGSTLQRNKQFGYLLLRAFGILLAISTQIISLLIGVIKTHDVVMNDHWRGVFCWLATICSAWSAIPIAFQCWRMYTDQTDHGFPSPSHTDPPPSDNLSEGSSEISESKRSELQIKLLAIPMEKKDPVEILPY